MNKPYRDYADYLSDRFGPVKVQKLTVNASLGCPNRDGTIGRGGCIYCNNSSFSPVAAGGTIEQQLERSRAFFAHKYPSMRFLAYFQSYTNTYGDIDRLMDMYKRALSVPGIIGLIIGTRPDCMPGPLLDSLARLNRESAPVIIEYGAESSHDVTLERINRCHTWDCTVDAVRRTHMAGLDVGLHFILGLPGENVDMMMHTVDRINTLPVDTVKFHQLQIVRGTPLGRLYASGGIEACSVIDMSLESYLDLCVDIIKKLRGDIAIERFVSQSPGDLLLHPRWGLKNYQFVNLLHARLAR